MADYYKILGISPSSSSNDIERAFYKLKAKFSSNDTEDPYFKNFYRRILEAHNVLSNDERRAQYDKIYRTAEINIDKKEDIKINSVEPIIEYFKSNKSLIEIGERIILSWNTTSANEVILTQSGKVAATGSKIIHYNDLVEDKTRFSLRVVNYISGKEATQDIFIKKSKTVSKIQENYPLEPIRKRKLTETENIASTKSISSKKDDSSQLNVKKYAIPSGVGVLLIALILFAIGKSGFWESKSQQVLENSVSNLKEKDPNETENNLSIIEKELFPEQFQTLNGQKLAYFDADIVLNELLLEIDKYTISNMPGYKADVMQFFNGTNNPIEWKSINTGGDNLIYKSQLNVGVEQQPYSEEKELVIEKLNFLKTGSSDRHLLKKIEFDIRDSGPPFWEPNNMWEAFQKILKSDFDKILLTDELNIKKEIYAINQIPPGFSKGYVVKNNGVIIPVSFSKKISENEPSSIDVIFYASMNTLMESEEYLSRMEMEGRILQLLELEDYRDFKLVSQFYADDIERYWDNQELNHDELQTLYQTAWSNTEYSFNDVQNIKMLNERNFELITDFKYLNKDGDTISQLNSTHFTFNEKGLIVEVYGVDSDFTYQNFRNNDFNSIDPKEKIKRLLKAEDDRDFNKIASFYSADMRRYWNVENPSFIQINDIYRNAWEASSYSHNIIINIESSSYETYDVEVRFDFYNNKTKQKEERENITRYVFNEKGLIEEVYGL